LNKWNIIINGVDCCCKKVDLEKEKLKEKEKEKKRRYNI